MKVELRDPNKIMKLSRLGSFHQSKLSFLRSFLNEFKEWEYKRDLFNLNENGFGEAVYSFKKNKRVYSLICFANEIKDEERSDRVIATKWDAAFTLHDGVPTKKDIERLKNEVPKQEVGRLSYKELTLSRANKSVRIYNHVVESLSKGKQPDLNLLSKVGYLYRTTAVYGSGKFGLADRFRIKNREEINGPFRLEMMLVYLVRQFTFDQVNHVAYHKNPKTAVKLDDNICKNLGIGNSTGLGMAPFIVNHPTLLNNWILSRERALKEIREIKDVKSQDRNLFIYCVKKSLRNITSWNTDSAYQQKKISSLLKDVEKFLNFIDKGFPNKKEEDWKFSDLSQIIKKNIGELSFYNDQASTNKVDTSVFVDGLEHNKIVFINGRIEKIDFEYEKKDQIEIIDQSETINEFKNSNSLSDLNNAFTSKCFKILVKKGYQLVKPLIIYHTTNSKIWSKNINLRLNFELDKDSSLRLVDLFNDTSEKNFLNIFYNFELKKNSVYILRLN